MSQTHYIAIDLGAESGRVMLGTLGERLSMRESHRFENNPIAIDGGLHWDIPRLVEQLLTGAVSAWRSAGDDIAGISADSWGVDYVLLGRDGSILSPPFIYRDPRTSPHYQRLLRKPGREFIFQNTGIQFMSINTLYQLSAEAPEKLQSARVMLPIADFINHLLADGPELCAAEISLASTTQLFDVQKRDWAWPLIEEVSLPRHIFPTVVESGTKLRQSQYVSGAEVLAGCSHDTACAVAAVPAEGDDQWAYLSSGTWSLVGVELPNPVVTDRCLQLGFTNELGAFGTTRLLKNVSGLYILQQCRAAWKGAGRDLSYVELATMAEKAEPLKCLIRPESVPFGMPGDMPSRIVEYCHDTAQSVPTEPGEFVRCIYESLALLYRKTIGELCELIGHPITRLHVVGGGSRSNLLNQLAADACGIPVIAGPVEATSIGNVLIQAAALGHISPADIRAIVRKSETTQLIQPAGNGRLIDAYERFAKLPIT